MVQELSKVREQSGVSAHLLVSTDDPAGGAVEGLTGLSNLTTPYYYYYVFDTRRAEGSFLLLVPLGSLKPADQLRGEA